MTKSYLPVTLGGFEPAAREILDPGVYDYIAGGAADECTLADNEGAWRRIPIVPRVLSGGGSVDMSATVLGRAIPHPILVAPMGNQRIASPEGESDMARAAAATGSILCLSTFSTVGAPAVACAAPECRRWFQVYVFTDRGVTHALVAEALACGYDALVVTVDSPAYGMRDRDTRSGYVVGIPVPAIASAGALAALKPEDAAGFIDPQLSWADIADLASRYRVPVLVKGVLSADDATRALAEGARGVVVSNHGGRQLDGTPATATVLASITDAVAGGGDVLVDGGIRRGTDVLRAVALGANGVMVGRPLYWGLAVGGAAGAQRVLELLLAEFANALRLSGAMTTRSLHRGYLGTP